MRVMDGEFSGSWINGTAPPMADKKIFVHLPCRCSPVLSLDWGRDMSKPRRFGGFYNIAGLGVNGPNSLVTISTCCDELSSPSYIKYHLVGLKPHFIGHVK